MIDSRFGRRVLGVCATTAMLVGCGGHELGSTVPAVTGGNVLLHHHTFYFTGREQTFKVPSGVESITVVARGAAGDGGSPSSYGHHYEYFGRGGRVYAVIPVKPSEILYVFVGGRGEGSYSGGNGFNGGGQGGSYPRCGKSNCYGYGGGGASDVRANGESRDYRILVAGGGGGAGTQRTDTEGGAGGGEIGGGGGGYYGGGGGGGGGPGDYGGSGGFPGGGGGGGSSYAEPRATKVKFWSGWKNATSNGLVVFSW